VNGQTIHRSVYETQLAIMANAAQDPMAELDDSPPPLPDLSVRAELLDILIRVELATQEAYQLGFAPGPEQIAEIEAKAVEAVGGMRELSDALAQTGGTMEQFRNQLARTEAMKAWRDNAFLAGARVTDEEARAFYEAHKDEATHGDEARALQIMFPLSLLQTPQTETAKKRAMERAREAAALAKAGRDFAELQRVFMDATTSAAVDGGNLGWVGKMGSFPELEELIFSLKPGEIGGPMETPFSIHVVKVLETRAAGTTPYMELKPGIVAAIADAKISMLVQERTTALLEAADISVLDPELAAAWAEFRRTRAVDSAPPDPGTDDGDNAHAAGDGSAPEDASEAAGDGSAPADSSEADGDGAAPAGTSEADGTDDGSAPEETPDADTTGTEPADGA
jgi:parvulin-like peptidyl-prolyl isomerase